MSRTSRLLQLMQLLRRQRRPVSAQALADQLNISTRTLYRDIATLQAQGADIRGEAGVGYVLKPGDALPPLMFNGDELQALMLGLRWVRQRGDSALEQAAEDATAKIASVLPAHLRRALEQVPLLVSTCKPEGENPAHGILLREAMQTEQKVQLHYRDVNDEATVRTIWPLGTGYFSHASVLIAWCELRADFRHFRLDRIAHIDLLPQHFEEPRQALLLRWYALNGIDPQ